MVSPCGLNAPIDAVFDPVRDRLFVADFFNSRVVAFDLSEPIINGMPAIDVFGQPDFATNTPNNDCAGQGSGVVNPCGLNFPSGVEVDFVDGRLFVADSQNNRVVGFPN